jgi:hypothetical protein
MHLLPPPVDLLHLALHSLAFLPTPRDLLFTFLHLSLCLRQIVLCLFRLFNRQSPLVSLDQSSQAFQLRRSLLIFEITPLFRSQLFQLWFDLLFEQLED